MIEYVAWALSLALVIILALLNIPIWVSAVVMVVWCYLYSRWIMEYIQLQFSA